jgi:hypothetical protein
MSMYHWWEGTDREDGSTERKMSMDHWREGTDRENGSTGSKTVLVPTIYHKFHTDWSDRPKTNP